MKVDACRSDVVTVAVIVVTYNHKDTIARCLDSIVLQRVDFPIKVYVADDASTDGTSDIVREYARRYPTIVPLIREKNMGAVPSCISALKQISSEFFNITEGDDYWCDPEKLKLQVEALRRHPECSCCSHMTEAKDKNGDHMSYIPKKCKGSYRLFDFMSAPPCHTTSLLYRNFLPSLGEREWSHLTGDGWYTAMALDRGKMIFLNRLMSVYNVSGEGAWSKLSTEEKAEIHQKTSFLMDQFFHFKYTRKFQRQYVPGNPKTLFSIWFPLGRRRLTLKLQMCNKIRKK